MTGKSEKQASVPVQTPLHLLQVLTRTLNEHLADACNQAQADAQEALDKLEQEQQALAKQLEQMQDEQPGDDSKASEELTAQMATLAKTRKDAEQYAAQLQSDVRQTLRLAKGLERIDLQVTQSIEKRNAPAAAGKRPPARRSRNRKPSGAAATAPAESSSKPEAKEQKNDPQQ